METALNWVGQTFFILLVFVLAVCLGTGNARFKVQSKPKIWLKSYQETDSFYETSGLKDDADFESIFVRKVDSEYAISSEVMQAEFACAADYPVTWTFADPTKFSGLMEAGVVVDTERTSHFNGTIPHPMNDKFLAYVKLTGLLFLSDMLISGELVCKSVLDKSVSSSIYVFVEGRSLLQNAEQLSQVSVSPMDSGEITIPCRPSVPDVTLTLYKRVAEEWHDISGLIPVKYSPREGFTFSYFTAVSSNLSVAGEYKCVVDGEEEIYSLLNVTLIESPSSTDFQLRKNVTSPAKLEVGKGTVSCCTGDVSSPPSGYTFGCGSEAECDVVKDVFMYDVMSGKRKNRPWTFDMSARLFDTDWIRPGKNTDCFKAHVQVPTAFRLARLFSCKGPGVDVVTQFITVNEDKDRANSDAEWELAHLFLGKFDTKGRLVDLSDRDNLTVANRLRVKIQASLLGLQYPFFGIHPIIHKPRLIPFSTSITGPLIEGQSIVVTCRPHPFFYSKGALLRLNWKNGTKTVLASISDDHYKSPGRYYALGYLDDNLLYGHPSSSMDVRAKISKLDVNMSSIDCYAPIWNEHGWDVVSHNLSVASATLPEIEEFPDKFTYLAENATFELNCTVKLTNESAFIRTNVYWEKDGKILSQNNGIGELSSVWSESGRTLKLELLPVTDLSQGEYTCIAENSKGQVRKAILVFVQSKTRGADIILVLLWTSGSLLIVLIFVALIMVWRWMKMK